MNFTDTPVYLPQPAAQHFKQLLCHLQGHSHTLSNELWILASHGERPHKFIPSLGALLNPTDRNCSPHLLILHLLESSVSYDLLCLILCFSCLNCWGGFYLLTGCSLIYYCREEQQAAQMSETSYLPSSYSVVMKWLKHLKHSMNQMQFLYI